MSTPQNQLLKKSITLASEPEMLGLRIRKQITIVMKLREVALHLEVQGRLVITKKILGRREVQEASCILTL